jgi:tetratricopeptide (TPR) repeat protein
MLSIVVTSAKFVCFLAITLDKDPSLLGNRTKAASKDDDSPISLAEGAVNNLRDAFNTCATDRASGLDSDGRPEGKKRGIYLIANICFKILFQCRKTSNATTFFEHIYLHSPPLSAYPKSQRVTYLYYLGAYLFENSHFYRAQLALQQAYDESPARPEFARQRRRILVYLITSNVIMGRFPSAALLQRPEAQGLYNRFMPLMQAIRSGNIVAFRQHLDYSSPHADFFLHFRILLQLRNRCEVLVWRSLIRKTWILNGTRYDRSGNSKAAPHVSIDDLLAVFYALEKRAQNPAEASWVDPDFEGAAGYEPDPEALLPNATSIESILSSLIEQGFLRGFLAHRAGKFVIMGAKQKGGDELAAGFPTPWEVVKQKADEEVPGWRKKPQTGAGGMVINLSGARPAGMA